MLDRRALRHRLDDARGCLYRCEWPFLWRGRQMLLQAFGLFDVENAVVAKYRRASFRRALVAALRVVRLLLAVKEFPEDNKLAFRPLLHSPAELLHLIEGQPVGGGESGRAEQERVNAPVRLLADEVAGAVAPA